MTQAIQAVEQVIIGGDLAKLNNEERLHYMNKLCNSLGLNPLTQPFRFLKLQGRIVLYAQKACTDQLRKLHGVSIKVISQSEADGLWVVNVRAQDKNGRSDEDIGAVTIAGLRGDARVNAMLKATTKAKRRVTLSICGLGMLDETEADDIPGASAVVWSPDEADESKKATGAPRIDEKASPDTKGPEQGDENVEPSIGHIEGFALFFPKTGETEESPLFIDTKEEWIKEYKAQMGSILNDDDKIPRERMTALKQFEELQLKTISKLPKEKAEALKEMRLKANKKLGAMT